MKIAGWVKTSLVEWSGKISAVIFTPGCNLRCPFCHNADLVDPKRASRSKIFSEKEVLKDLNKRKKWLDAVVISGGEPTLQKDLPFFLSSIKALGYLIMIQTNGTNPQVVKRLLDKKLLDYISIDVKGDLENYANYSGRRDKTNHERIRETILLVKERGIEYELRTTVVPGLHNLKNLEKLAGQVGKVASEACWHLQQFRPTNTLDAKFSSLKPYFKKEMEVFQKRMQKHVPQIFLRGV